MASAYYEPTDCPSVPVESSPYKPARAQKWESDFVHTPAYEVQCLNLQMCSSFVLSFESCESGLLPGRQCACGCFSARGYWPAPSHHGPRGAGSRGKRAEARRSFHCSYVGRPCLNAVIGPREEPEGRLGCAQTSPDIQAYVVLTA